MRAEHLSRTYAQGGAVVPAINDVSLNLARGDVACILGRSGSGKSTLLHILGALDRPTTGRVWLGDVEIGTMSEAERVRVRRTLLGFVFQSLNLLPALNAEENVALPLRYAGVARQERVQRARELLVRVGLGTRVTALPHELSGGEQQRVALARALAARPVLVLADEPTGELDTATSDEVAALFVELNQTLGTTFLIVTHDERLAAHANRVFHMEDGRVSERTVMA